MFIVLFILAQSEWMCLCTPLVLFNSSCSCDFACKKINNPPGYKRIKVWKCLSKTITLPFYRQLKPKMFALFISLVESTFHQVCDTSLSWPKCEIKTKWAPLRLYLKTIQGTCPRVNGTQKRGDYSREVIISNIAHWKSCPKYCFIIQLNQKMIDILAVRASIVTDRTPLQLDRDRRG